MGKEICVQYGRTVKKTDTVTKPNHINIAEETQTLRTRIIIWVMYISYTLRCFHTYEYMILIRCI